jgi:hypothetical protein
MQNGSVKKSGLSESIFLFKAYFIIVDKNTASVLQRRIGTDNECLEDVTPTIGPRGHPVGTGIAPVQEEWSNQYIIRFADPRDRSALVSVL